MVILVAAQQQMGILKLLPVPPTAPRTCPPTTSLTLPWQKPRGDKVDEAMARSGMADHQGDPTDNGVAGAPMVSSASAVLVDVAIAHGALLPEEHDVSGTGAVVMIPRGSPASTAVQKPHDELGSVVAWAKSGRVLTELAPHAPSAYSVSDRNGLAVRKYGRAPQAPEGSAGTQQYYLCPLHLIWRSMKSSHLGLGPLWRLGVYPVA
jgi:hypothetical protein